MHRRPNANELRGHARGLPIVISVAICRPTRLALLAQEAANAGQRDIRPCLDGSFVFTAACEGPTSPDSGSAQTIVENPTPTIMINGSVVQAGSTVPVSVGATVSYRYDVRNNSGQVFHDGILIVRDDGPEQLIMCGASASGGDGGASGVSSSMFPNHPIYTPGHTVRVYLLGALGPNVQTGPGQCYLQLTQGVPNHANVQSQRLLVTLTVQ
jgi:hypothetical protein